MIESIIRPIGRAIGQHVVNTYNHENAQLNEILSKLTPQQSRHLDLAFMNHKKSVGVGYAAAFSGGWHYLYLGQPVKQIIFWLTAGGMFCWWVFDLIIMFFMVDASNRKAKLELVRKIIAGTPKPAAARPAPQPQTRPQPIPSRPALSTAPQNGVRR